MSGPKKGRAWLLKIKIGEVFTALSGINGKSLSVNGERIDATIPNALNPDGPVWRATLDGVRSVDFSGDGRTVKGAPATALQEAVHGETMCEEFQLVIPNWGTYEGLFSLKLEFGDDGTVTYSISGESNGVIAFNAEAAE